MSTAGRLPSRHNTHSKEAAVQVSVQPGHTDLQTYGAACRTSQGCGSKEYATENDASSAASKECSRQCTPSLSQGVGTAKTRNSSQEKNSSVTAIGGLLHSRLSANQPPMNVRTAPAARKTLRSGSMPRKCLDAYTGLAASGAGEVPGRAKVVASNVQQSSKCSSAVRSSVSKMAGLGLAPAVVATTNRPLSARKQGTYLPANTNGTAQSPAVSRQASSRSAGLSRVTSLESTFDTAQVASLKQYMQTANTKLRPGTFSNVAVDAVAAGKEQVRQCRQQGQTVPAMETLTHPGTTEQQPIAGQASGLVGNAASTAVGSQACAGVSSTHSGSRGSATSETYLSRLDPKNKNPAATAASTAAITSINSSSAFAFERLKTLRLRQRIRPGSTDNDALQELIRSSGESSGKSSRAAAAAAAIAAPRHQQCPLACKSRSAPGSSSLQKHCNAADAQDSTVPPLMHPSSLEELLAHNQGQLAEALSELRAPGAASRGTAPPVERSRSYSSVAAAPAGSSAWHMNTTSQVHGQVSNDRDPAVAGSSKATSLAAATGSAPVLDKELQHSFKVAQSFSCIDTHPSGHVQAAAASHDLLAALSCSLDSMHTGNTDCSRGLYRPPSSRSQHHQQRPLYNPVEYERAAAEALRQRSSSESIGANRQSICLTAADGGNLSTEQQQPFCAASSPSQAACGARAGGSSQGRRLSDGHTNIRQQQQLLKQASLSSLGGASSGSVDGNPQPSCPTAIDCRTVGADAACSRPCAMRLGAAVSAAATDAKSQQVFPTATFDFSNHSLDTPAAGTSAAGPEIEQQQPPQQPGQTAASVADSERKPVCNQCQEHQQLQQRQLYGSTAAPNALDSDSDVSEMSSSLSIDLDQPTSCSSEDRDSVGGGISAATAARRRLVGGQVAVSSSSSSSSSISFAGGGSGSGVELEGWCSRQAQSSLELAMGRLPAGCAGLYNLGNTCFMNSILQCLNCLPEFVLALLGRKILQAGVPLAAFQCSTQVAGAIQWPATASVGPALHELFKKVWSLQQHDSVGAEAAAHLSRQRVSCVVSPRRLLHAVAAADGRWSGGCQQDSQEFLHSLLEQLQSECNRVISKPKYKELSSEGTEAQQAAEASTYARSWHDSPIDDLFGGLLQSTVTCSNCQHQSHCFDTFLDLSVPIPKTRHVSVQDCLSAFVEQEVLSGREQVTCSLCKKTCNATKRLQIYAYPQVLVLTLKRFNSCIRGGTGSGSSWLGSFSSLSKNETAVTTQQALDLLPYCSAIGLKSAAAAGLKAPQYELLAVSKHSGCLGGGHYTAHGRSVVNKCWYEFDDLSVTCNSHPRCSSSAYVLFYRLLDV